MLVHSTILVHIPPVFALCRCAVPPIPSQCHQQPQPWPLDFATVTSGRPQFINFTIGNHHSRIYFNKRLIKPSHATLFWFHKFPWSQNCKTDRILICSLTWPDSNNYPFQTNLWLAGDLQYMQSRHPCVPPQSTNPPIAGYTLLPQWYKHSKRSYWCK